MNRQDFVWLQETSSQLPLNSGITTVSSTSNVLSTIESSEYRNCLSNCQSTGEYNPVCGSNGVTYDNFGKLLCATRCGTSKYNYHSILILLQTD